MEVRIDGNNLTIEQLHLVARENAKVSLTDSACKKINESEQLLQQLVKSGELLYGITTGIGDFAKVIISPQQSEELQKRIIYSHAASVGNPFPDDMVRAAMLLRANVLAKGYSAVRLSTIDTLLQMINKSVIPVIYEKGSVGTSGDLSPLSQMAEVVMGEGEAYYQGERLPGKEAMYRAQISPVKLTYKEGLGLINGSQMSTAVAALTLYDAERLLKNAQIASAMTIDVLKSILRAFDSRLHAVRPFNGQNLVAKNIRKLVEGSEILAKRSKKVQDGYSLRCTPQVIGPSKDALGYVKQQLEIEMNSAADNPLFFPEDAVCLAGGNFHGQPIAIACDLMCIALAELANLSERHINRLLNPVLSGLPDFLIENKGLNSGFMIAQYTAAALVSENKVLSHPASVDSIPVSADQEDHVSMASISASKSRQILQNVTYVLAIEMMCAAQAMDFRKPAQPGYGTRVAYNEIRKVVPNIVDDQPLYPFIEKIAALIRDNTILQAVENEIGELE